MRVSRKMTTEQFVGQARMVHGDFYDYSDVEYDGIKKKVRIICPRHGPFMQAPEQHLDSHGCPVCAAEKRRATMLARHGVEYAMQCKAIRDKANASKDARFGCRKAPDSGRKAMGRDEFVRRAVGMHGDKYDYSLVEYVNNSTKVTILCPVHGSFEQAPAKHLMGRGCPHPDCIAEKKAATNMARFGARNAMQSDVVKNRLARSNIERYGVANPMQRPDIAEHAAAANLIRYGVRSTLQLDDVKKASLETKLANGSFNASAPEERLYGMLCAAFGEGGVERQYASGSYPFACDFHVKSRDLYVELNANFTHGGRWYAGNEFDLAQLDTFREKSAEGHAYYDNVIHVWTEADVRKRETARDGNLNYVVFWDGKLRDAELWFAMGCPDGRDWDCEYSWLPDREITGIESRPSRLDGPASYSRVAKQYQFGVFYAREIAMWRENPVKSGIPLRVFLWHNRYKYAGKLPGDLTDLQLARGFTTAGILKGYTVFDAELMEAVLAKYDIKSVYDPCAGWGERMLCCFAHGVAYHGVDVNGALKPGYDRVISDFGITEQSVDFADAAACDIKFKADAVVTCPPYGGLEKYSAAGAENLDGTAFLDWWRDVVRNACSADPEWFCFQIDTPRRDAMLGIVEHVGFRLVDELSYDKPRSGHFTRRKGGIDLKRTGESMLVCRRSV